MDVTSKIYDIMEKEISAVKRVSLNLFERDKDYENIVNLIVNLKGRLIFTGVGKSGHIGEKLAATFASTGTPSFFIHSTEAVHGDLGMIEKEDLIIDISNSGETAESVVIIEYIQKIGAKTVALTGNENSTLAKICDYILPVNVTKEADRFNLAPTNSSTAVLVVGDAIALTVSELKNFTKVDFAKFHPGGNLGKRLEEEKV